MTVHNVVSVHTSIKISIEKLVLLLLLCQKHSSSPKTLTSTSNSHSVHVKWGKKKSFVLYFQGLYNIHSVQIFWGSHFSCFFGGKGLV